MGLLTLPTMTLGRSKISRLIVKQNVQGTGFWCGVFKIQEYMHDLSVLSKACVENFSQYSTADRLSINYKHSGVRLERTIHFPSLLPYLVNVCLFVQQRVSWPLC